MKLKNRNFSPFPIYKDIEKEIEKYSKWISCFDLWNEWKKIYSGMLYSSAGKIGKKTIKKKEIKKYIRYSSNLCNLIHIEIRRIDIDLIFSISRTRFKKKMNWWRERSRSGNQLVAREGILSSLIWLEHFIQKIHHLSYWWVIRQFMVQVQTISKNKKK